MKIILSIDGGGIRGIIPAVFLQKLENEFKIKLVNHVDLIVGTSTGGILTAGMVKKTDMGEWKYNFDDIVDFYLKDGKYIFYESEKRYKSYKGIIGKLKNSLRNFYYMIKDLFNDERYSSNPIDKIFKQRFGDETPLNFIDYPNIMLTGFDFNNQKAVLMKSHNNKYGLKLWEAVKITSSAPTYFEPYCIADMILVDGGLFANDPSMSAYIEIKKLYPTEDFIIVSIGTGDNSKNLTCEEVSNWSDITWLKPLISSFMNGPNSATQHYLEVLEKVDPNFKKYFRFQIDMLNFEGSMDDASEDTLKQLVNFGNKMYYENLEKLKELNIYLNNKN